MMAGYVLAEWVGGQLRRGRSHALRRVIFATYVMVVLSLFVPPPGSAVLVHLIGRDLVGSSATETFFFASGCGEYGRVAIQLPPGSTSIRPDLLNSVGTYLYGPDGFLGKYVV